METNQTESTVSKTQAKKLTAQEHNRLNPPSVNEAPLTLEQREELEALSKSVYNSTSHYQTLMRKGEKTAVTETVTEYIPDKNGGEGSTKEVQVPVNYQNSKKSIVLKMVYHTYDSIKVRMLEIKAQQDKVREMIAKMQADQRAEQEKVQKDKEEAFAKRKQLEQLSGSAL